MYSFNSSSIVASNTAVSSKSRGIPGSGGREGSGGEIVCPYHRANLVNFGIMPLTFTNEADYDKIQQGDKLEIANVRAILSSGKPMVLRNVTRSVDIPVTYEFTDRQKQLLLAGGLLNYIKQSSSAAAKTTA
jgi:hypothetical protein